MRESASCAPSSPRQWLNTQTNNSRIDRTTKKKFSNCLKTLVIDMDNREPQNFPESNIVEVRPARNGPHTPLPLV